MAKKSMIAKQQRTPKFAVRAYTRCSVCGRPHSVKVYYLVLEKLVGRRKKL